ncbi:MAG: SpoIIE family protein phosphatase [Clostridia bacterium]|nr:SpoIIE family protein phosphatase [Clostridia bacterium]
MKKEVIKYTLYAVILVFLHYLEYRVGVYAFSTAFLFALTWGKQNLIILAPLYALCGLAFNFSLWGALYLVIPVLVVLIVVFIHYKIGKSITKLHAVLYSFLSLIPRIVIESSDLESAVLLVGGGIISLPLTFAFESGVHAVVNKKLNYELSRLERASLCFVVAVMGLGLRYLNLYFFSFYWFICIFAITIAPCFSLLSALEVGLSFGLGALPFGVEPFAMAVALGVLSSFFPKEHAYFGGVLAIALESTLMLLGIVDGNYLGLIAPGVATIISLAIPIKVKRKIYTRFYRGVDNVTRTLINKNRADIKDKLGNLSNSLYDVSNALASEDGEISLNQMELAIEVVNRACKRCPHYQRCKKCLGGNGTEIVIQELMGSAIEMGKASILDASPFLSSRCVNLNTLIVKANEVLYERQEEKRNGEEVSENKKLLKEQVEGIAEVLNVLSLDAGSPLRYDVTLEKRLKDAFNEEGVGVNEILAFEDGRISMSVKESDILKPKLRETVSRIVGTPMWIYDKKTGINGEVCTFWEREPKYRVAFGERVQAREGRGSGDKEAVIRLNSHKVMLCLADGMGHGKEAGENSSCAMSLIEALYRAGFNHETVLKSVGTLLKVRNKEEFNAIDIAVIDTETGDVDVIKQGAREGYVITPEGLKEISCGSLPLGIIDGVSPVTQTLKLTPRDFIVMFSDGVIDGLGKERLEEILTKVDTRNPDEICERVMSNVEKIAPDERDDCSMICARLF